jgi:rhodanese-related sulfurtransferase
VPVPEISCEELSARLARSDKPLLVDVRNPDEHEYCALPGSLLLPLPEIDRREDEVLALAGKDVVVYCHHGVRSLHGAAFLRSKGVEASSLAGGIDRWSQVIDPSVRRY